MGSGNSKGFGGHQIEGDLDPRLITRNEDLRMTMDLACKGLVTTRNTEFMISVLRGVPPELWKTTAPGIISTLPRGRSLARVASGGRSALGFEVSSSFSVFLLTISLAAANGGCRYGRVGNDLLANALPPSSSALMPLFPVNHIGSKVPLESVHRVL